VLGGGDDDNNNQQASPELDPAYNPAMLPPRSRTDVVQERPAGGSAAEVAAANPGLAAAVPAAVGQSGPTPADTAAEVRAHNLPTTTTTQGSGTTDNTDTTAAAGGKGEPAVAGAGMRLGDGSDMEVPELAVLPSQGDDA
jgi:hypothetical protein